MPHSESLQYVLTCISSYMQNQICASRRKRTPADDSPRQMLLLLLELLQSDDLPELAAGGAWDCTMFIMMRGSAALGLLALEADICGIGTTHLRAVGCAADWMVSPWSYVLCIIRKLGCRLAK
eukprot:COSAG02_NODE_1624_length_11594_cov_6.314833_11_plen_123_part_00